MKKQMVSVLFSYLLIYVFNFVVIPLFFHLTGRVYFMGLMDSGVSLIITFAVLCICMWKLSDSLLLWFAGIPFYLLLMLLYIPKGIYGIGMKGIFVQVYDPEAIPFGIAVVIGITLFEAFAAWVLVKLLKVGIRFKNRR